MKVPCGGFDLDESVFNVDKNSKQVKLNSPISYDYMPEGYPKKDIGNVTLMEEQEVAFTEKEGLIEAVSPVALDIKLGDKLTVVWDGVSYNVTVTALDIGPSEAFAFGNLGLTGIGDTEDYPFVYMMFNSKAQWATSDTATSHTIKVMRQQVTITPMSTDFIPKNLNVVFILDTSGDTNMYSCNVTYGALRGWMNRHIPVVATIYVGTDEVHIISSIEAYSNYLQLAYTNIHGDRYKIVYNSDGSIGVSAS